MTTTDNSRADALTDDAILAKAKHRVYSPRGAEVEHYDFSEQELIAFARDILAASPVSQPAAASIPYDGLTEEFADEVARLANDAPGIREAIAGALESCKAIIAPKDGAAPAPSPADEREALSDQDIYDKFSFLEGLVNESTYVRIADTAIEIARAGYKS